MTRAGADIAGRVQALIAPHGLIVRGAINFLDSDAAPPARGSAPARSVLLIGNAGAGYWPIFEAWRAQQADAIANPLDAWCRAVIGAVADATGGRAVSPSDRPYLPFQQWAMRAEGIRPSPLGVLIHPVYGPWHAYRGALLFDKELPLAPHEVSHVCDLCVGKACKKACPVDAHAGDAFAYQDCLAHVRSDAGDPCRATGCLDRNACPVGVHYRYPAHVQAFHMAAFAR